MTRHVIDADARRAAPSERGTADSAGRAARATDGLERYDNQRPGSDPSAADRLAAGHRLLLACHDVARTFGSGPAAVVAVHGAHCTVTADDRVAIAGPSGSGKSTLLHLMAGLEAPTRGTLSWPGLPEDPTHRARRIGVVFQSPSLIPTLTAAENVALPLALAGVSEADAQARAYTCLQRVDAESLAAKLPEELSGGQAQRVAVARVLAQQPALILADEPTGQLDHAAGQRVIEALLSAARDLDAGLVISTHDPAVTERLDRRWLMHEGRLTLDTPAMTEARP